MIKGLRILVGVIAAWQALGLLPVLTTWLPNANAVPGNLWAVAFLKGLVLLICGGMFWWLGRIIKNRSSVAKNANQPGVGLALLLVISAGITLGIAIPAFNRSGSSESEHARRFSHRDDVGASSLASPTYNSVGWTQESTGSTDVGPWLNYDPPGTRYYRDANRVIYRLFPPGVRPDAEKANPFGLGDSAVHVPQ